MPYGAPGSNDGKSVKANGAVALMLSALVFAGGAQFAVLALWTGPLPLAAIVLTAFLVNARHIVMGAALHPYISTLPRRMVLPIAGGMTDAGWAITLQEMMRGKRDLGILLGTIIMQWPIWVGGTAIGALIGSSGMEPKRWGLDVLIAGVFATSVVGLYRGRSDIVPVLAAIGGAIAALLWLPGNWYILIGGLAAGLAGLLRDDD